MGISHKHFEPYRFTVENGLVDSLYVTFRRLRYLRLEVENWMPMPESAAAAAARTDPTGRSNTGREIEVLHSSKKINVGGFEMYEVPYERGRREALKRRWS